MMKKYKVLITKLDQIKGLMFSKLLNEFFYVFIFQKESKDFIHTWFMGGPIDIVFFDFNGHVLSCHENVKPWRLVKPNVEFRYFIEVPAGYIHKHNIKLSQRYNLEINGMIKNPINIEIKLR